jgi:hypothetical protein
MREANQKALKRKLGSDSFVEDELRRTETTEAKGRRCKVVLAHVRALEGLAGDSEGGAGRWRPGTSLWVLTAAGKRGCFPWGARVGRDGGLARWLTGEERQLDGGGWDVNRRNRCETGPEVAVERVVAMGAAVRDALSVASFSRELSAPGAR